MYHFSRKCVGFALFKNQPTSEDVIRALNKAIRKNKKPKYIVSDKSSQFFPNRAKPENRKHHPYLRWCARKKIKPRFGAIGKRGSIAVIERFIRSMKDECTRPITIPLNMDEMRTELSLYVHWYSEFRPHQSLTGLTPEQKYRGESRAPPLQNVKVEDPPATTESLNKGGSTDGNTRYELNVSYLEGRRHLPIVELRKAE